MSERARVARNMLDEANRAVRTQGRSLKPKAVPEPMPF
jgi:hypothetical protein